MIASVLNRVVNQSAKCPACKQKTVSRKENGVLVKASAMHYDDGRIEIKCHHCGQIYLAASNN